MDENYLGKVTFTLTRELLKASYYPLSKLKKARKAYLLLEIAFVIVGLVSLIINLLAQDYGNLWFGGYFLFLTIVLVFITRFGKKKFDAYIEKQYLAAKDKTIHLYIYPNKLAWEMVSENGFSQYQLPYLDIDTVYLDVNVMIITFAYGTQMVSFNPGVIENMTGTDIIELVKNMNPKVKIIKKIKA